MSTFPYFINVKPVNCLRAIFLTSVLSLGACSNSHQEADIQTDKQETPQMALMDGKFSTQLWTFRYDLIEDPAATLQRVSDMGFTHIEAFDEGPVMAGPEAFRALTDAAGLDVMALHWNRLNDWREDPQKIIDIATTVGAEHIVISWLKERLEPPVTEENVLEAADLLANACDLAEQAGIGLAYHIHGYELQPANESGRTFFDGFMDRIENSCVKIQMDAFWVTFAGQDPLEFMDKYGHSINMMHIKDMAEGRPTGVFDGVNFLPPRMPGEYFVPLGAGKIDYPSLLKSAENYDLEWYIIEMDHAQDPYIDTAVSIDYLVDEGFLSPLD